MPPKRNAFFNFMVKRRRELEGQGERFPGGWREVSLAVAQEWQEMSADDKKEFAPNPVSSSSDWEGSSENQATPESGSSNYNVVDCNRKPERPTIDELMAPVNPSMKIAIQEGRMLCDENDSFKMNTLGGHINALYNSTKKMLRYEEHLEKEINKVLFRDNIPDMVFTLVTCNTWCKTNDKKFIPSEIALLAFSLRSGVVDQYSTLIDPGHIPPGLGYEASVSADKLFLPLPPFDVQYQNYREILKRILEFMGKYENEHDPGFLFCLRADRSMIYSSLQWLCDKAESEYKFELYPYEFLVMHLSKMATTDAVIREEENQDCHSLPPELDSLFSGSFKSEDVDTYFSSVSTFTIDYRKELDPYLPLPLKKANVEKTIFNSEEIVLLFIDRLIFGSMEFLGCLHHMVYSDVVHHCALNRLNRYAFQTMDMLILNFGVRPVKGVNFIDTTASTEGEKEKRVEMLEKWGLQGKEYPDYRTPIEREQQRALEIELIIKNTKENKVEVKELEIQHLAPLFRKQEKLPEFVALNCDSRSEPLPAVQVQAKKFLPRPPPVQQPLPTVKPSDEEYSEIDDDDDWSYVQDHN